MADFRQVRRGPNPTRQAAIRWNTRRQRLLGGGLANVGLTGTPNDTLVVTDETIYPIFENFDPDAGTGTGVGGNVNKDDNGKSPGGKIKITNLKNRFGDKSWLGLVNDEHFDGSGNFRACAEFMWVNRSDATTHTDFTIEAWIFPFDAHDTDYRPIMCSGTVDTTASFGANSGGFWLSGQDIGFTVNSTNLVTATDVVEFNTWSHVAVSRSGSTIRLYVNGVQVASAANSTTWSWDGGKAFIGTGPCPNPTGIGAVRSFYGFMDDVVFHDSGLYTTTPFTPPASYADYSGSLHPTITFPPITGSHLFHFDDSFEDEFGATTTSFAESGGIVERATNLKYFGTKSLHTTNPSFTNTGGNYFNTGINLGTQDFVIDFWMYCNFNSGNLFDIAVCGGRGTNGTGAHVWGLQFQDNVDDAWHVTNTNTTSDLVLGVEDTTVLNGQWAHVIIKRTSTDDIDGNSAKFRIMLPQYATGAAGQPDNGDWQTIADADWHTADFGTLVFGGDNSARDASDLYIDELRVTLGADAVAEYDCEDPPLTRLEPYRTSNANTFLSAVRADVRVDTSETGVRQFKEIVYDGYRWNGLMGTFDVYQALGGDMSIDTTITKGGVGSLKLDQGDQTTAQRNAGVVIPETYLGQYHVPANEAYTFECWVRPKDWVTGTDAGTMRRQHLVGFGNNNNGTNLTMFQTVIGFYESITVLGAANNSDGVSSTQLTPDQWNHIAICRDAGTAGTHRLYINGTFERTWDAPGEVNRQYAVNQYDGMATYMFIGTRGGRTTQTPCDLYGNIEGVRWIVGESLYAEDFTPADVPPPPPAFAPDKSDSLFNDVMLLMVPDETSVGASMDTTDCKDVSNNAYAIDHGVLQDACNQSGFTSTSNKRWATGANAVSTQANLAPRITPPGAESQITGDFTIEFFGFLYSASGLDQGLLHTGTAGNPGYFRVAMDTNNPESLKISYRNSLNTADVVATFDIEPVKKGPLASWWVTEQLYHIVIQKDGNYPAVAIDGIWLTSDLAKDANDQLGTLGTSGGSWDVCGSRTGGNQPMYFEAARITRAARYTVGTNFSKRKEAFPWK